MATGSTSIRRRWDCRSPPISASGPIPASFPEIAELARSIPEVVECHRITGEDCFILKAHFPAMDQLDRLLDQFLVYGTTTTSIVQSTPVPLRLPPLPNLE